MKKVLVFGACIVALAGFSFFKTVSDGPLKKVGKGLYESKSTASLKPADQEKLKAELTKTYGIKSFTQNTTVHYTNITGPKGQKGVSFAEAVVGASVFQARVMADGDIEVKQACIYDDCPPPSTRGALVQVLQTYAVQ